MEAYDAILFPVHGPAKIFPLMTSLDSLLDPVTGARRTTRTPHPELYMSLSGSGLVCERIASLYGMNRTFSDAFVVFYAAGQRSEAALAVNACIAEIQGRGFREQAAWRGDVVVVKYRNVDNGDIVCCPASDFPLVKNFFALHYPQH